MKSYVEGLEKTQEGLVKTEMLDNFIVDGMAAHKRPTNYKGECGLGEASCQLQIRGERSTLTEEQAQQLKADGVAVTAITAPEQFYFNNTVLANPELRDKICRALSLVDCGKDEQGNPVSIVLHQPAATVYVADEGALDAAFGLPTKEKVVTCVKLLTSLLVRTKFAGDMGTAWNVIAKSLKAEKA